MTQLLLRVTLTFAVSAFFFGCSFSFFSKRFDPSSGTQALLERRRAAYERLTNTLEVGMTRRQLYALLPPQRPPDTLGPHLSIFYDRPKPASATQEEFHRLDPQFRLRVVYNLADSDILQAPSPRPTTQELISGNWEPRRKWTKSTEDPNDTLNVPPQLQQVDAPRTAIPGLRELPE